MNQPCESFGKHHNRTANVLGWLLALLLCTLVAPVGAAQPSVDPTIEAIRSRMDEGQALFAAGKFKEAAQVFEQGYQGHPYSAFLFNAGVCHQKVGDLPEALVAFRRYLEKDPQAPDAAQVKERIAKIEAEIARAASSSSAGPEAKKESSDTAAPETMKSLVVVETDPVGAPIKIYRREKDDGAAFSVASTTWKLTAERESPAQFTLDVGRYHIVVEKFGQYNKSETDIDVSPGHVHQFKANLSQGAFMSFLRVRSNVVGAFLYVDDDGKKKIAWGRAPYGQLIAPGKHSVLIEAPGYEPARRQLELAAGEQKDLEIKLERVAVGVMRIDANVPFVEIFVDAAPVGKWKKGDVALEVELPAGEHALSVRSSGYKDLNTTIQVPRGQILPMRAELIATYPRGAAWAQAIVAAGLIGASTYFAVESNRLESELTAERARGTLTNSDARIDQGFWYSVGANGGFALGGVFGVLSIYNFVRDPNPDSSLRRGKRLEFAPSQEEGGFDAVFGKGVAR